MSIDLTTRAEREAQKAEDLPAFSGIKLLHIKRSIAELLRQIGGNGIFDEYTRHDISHIDAMLELLDWLIPADTRDKLTAADWLMTVLAIYFHDLAMLVTKDEFKRRDESGFREFCDRELFQGDQGIDYRAKIDKLPPAERERFLYQEFIRHKHAERIRCWVTGQARDGLGVSPQLVKEIDNLLRNLDAVFRRDLGAVCESHHLDDLGDCGKYSPRQPYGQSTQETANLQYCAILLRTADLLHVTRDRTPSLTFRTLNPSDPISQQEWAKQMAVRSVRPQLGRDKEGNFSETAPQDTVEIYANFKSPDGFFGLTSYLSFAQNQLRKSNEWVESSRRSQGVTLAFPWKYIDTGHIETDGFLSKTFQFTIDQAKILDLLTGHTLYNDASIVLRELAQNAIDAVRLQCRIEGKASADEGKIAINWESKDRVLSIQDNGTGMSQSIIENHLLKVGASRYQDPEFKKKHPDFCPISRFGIGILSAFMVADSVEIVTCHQDDEQARQLTLKSVHGRYLINLLDKEKAPDVRSLGKHGTRIRLHVRPSAKKFDDPLQIARKWIVIPNCRVTIKINGKRPIRIGFKSPREALENVLEADGYKVIGASTRPKHRDVRIQELEAKDSGVLLAFATVWSAYFQEWSFLIHDRETTEQYDFLVPDETGEADETVLGDCSCVEGIRVKSGSPGFEGPCIYAIGNAVGPRAPRTNVARSALEQTPELNEMLEALYRLYCQHVKDEMTAQHEKRGLSLTWAVQEAGYLLETVFRPAGKGLTNHSFASKAVADVVPMLLLEEGHLRRAVSLTEFRQQSSFCTVHGDLFLSAERLLREVPGKNSLRSLIEGMGEARLALPNGPVLCGDLLFNPLEELAFEGREPIRFDINYSQRRLDVLWGNVSSPARWVRMPKISQRLGRLEMIRSKWSSDFSEMTFYGCWICVGKVIINGMQDEEIVKVGSSHFVLPDTHIAAFLLKVRQAFSRCLADKQRRCIYGLLGRFESCIGSDRDRLRDMERFYEDETEDIAKLLPLKVWLDALKTTKCKVFDTSKWSRAGDGDDED